MKQVSENSIENDFFKGHFKKIIQLENIESGHNITYLIGSYCMTNNSHDAELLFRKSEEILFLNKDQHLLCLFFLGLGCTRDSKYKSAKEYFLKLFQNRTTLFHDYLIQQGLGFYNFFICRYEMADFWLNKNEKTLSHLKILPFWKLIYLDLAAHVSIKRGRIQQGFLFIKKATKIAAEIENKFVAEALAVSLVSYESLYGLDQKKSLLDLKKLLKQYTSHKNFYYFNLSLEFIRRLNLNGDLSSSESHLRAIEKDIFQSSLQRQKSLWSFRFAHLLYLQGKAVQSLHQIESALEYLDPKQDLSAQVQILGLKYKILKSQGADVSALIQKIQKITFFCKDTQSLSYAYRNGWHNKPVTEDPYAQFFHSWKRGGHKNYSALQRVLGKEWISLFVDLLPVDRINFIYLDVLPKKALVFSESGIAVAEGLTPLIRQSLLLLSRQVLSKKHFVEYLWGYEYDSYRHDTLVYTLVGRLREFLGKHADLLKMQDNKIELLQTQVRVYDHHSHKPQIIEKTVDSDLQATAPALNYRQIELIDFLNANRFVGVSEASQFLHVPKITACRDLTDLLKLNIVTKTGLARATKYTLAEHLQTKRPI